MIIVIIGKKKKSLFSVIYQYFVFKLLIFLHLPRQRKDDHQSPDPTGQTSFARFGPEDTRSWVSYYVVSFLLLCQDRLLIQFR